MDVVATLISWLERVATVLGYAALPALVVAIAMEWRHGLGGRGIDPAGLLGAGAIAVMAGLGLGAALVTDVPIGIGASGLAVILLTGVLLPGRRSFWVVFALLTVVVTIAAVLQLLALSYNAVSSSGLGQLGARQLVAFGGINANPGRPGWQWAIIALATLAVGVPLGFSLSAAWTAATAPMGRVSRLALVLASGSVGVTVLTSTVLYLFTSINAAILGLPWVLAVPAVLAGVLLLVLVGPGQVAALFAPTRLLFMRAYDAARAVAEAAGAVGEVVPSAVGDDGNPVAGPPPDGAMASPRPLRSFLGWVGGTWSWQHRLSVEFLVVLVVFVATGEIAEALATGEPRTVQVATYESIDRQVDVGFRVTESVLDGDVVWLAGTDGELARFDAATQDLVTLEVTVASIVADPDGSGIVALSPDPQARVLHLTAPDTTPDKAADTTADAGPDSVPGVALEDGFSGDLAVHDGLAWVLAPDGRLGAWRLDDGTAVRRTEGPPGSEVEVGDSGVWTRHVASDSDEGASLAEVRHVRRDPATLEVLLDTDDTILSTFFVSDLYVPASGRPWAVSDDVVARLDPATGELDRARPHAAVPTIDAFQPEARLIDVRDDAPTAVTVPQGAMSRIGPEAEPTSFHYDTIQGVYEVAGDTWLVVADDRSTFLGRDDGRPSMLARWDQP